MINMIKKYILSFLIIITTFLIAKNVAAYSPLNTTGLDGDDRLVSWINFDDQTLNNQTGGTDGQAVGGTAYANTAPLFSSYYLNLTGTNAGFWNYETDINFNSNTFSVSYWLYPTYDEERYIQWVNGSTKYFNVYIDNLTPIIYWKTTSITQKTLIFTDNLTINTWNNIVITRNQNLIQAYLNGELQGNYINDAGTETDIGHQYYFGQGTDGYGQRGKLDDFSTWNEDLQPADVYRIYNGTFAPTTLNIDVVAYNTSTQQVILTGTCEPIGTGVNQLRTIGTSGTSTFPTLPDPLGTFRGELGDCATSTERFSLNYDGRGLTGVHTLAVADYAGELTFQQYDDTSLDFSFVGIDWTDPTNFFTNNSSTLGITAHNLACTPEQWAAHDAATTTPLISICEISEIFWSIGLGFSDMIKGLVQTFITGFQSIFPFNIAYQFYNAWTTSENQSLPTGLSWLTTNATDNMYITMPKELTGAATDTPMLAFGSDIFEDNAIISEFFEFIRSLSTYLLWTGFLYLIYGLAHKTYDEINYEKTIEHHEKENYQL